MSSNRTRVLLIDSYDSFTYNLAALFRRAIPDISIQIIKNDDFTFQELLPRLKYFSAVIIGPGPGSPEHVEDIGVVKDLWKLKDEDVLPIFGVCLGLQSMALEYGALVKRLHTVKHGQISHIYHRGVDLFNNIPSVRAVRYHSLQVELNKNKSLEELAWTEDKENGRVVMAIRHKKRPYWAVQYHPESVCTEGGGIQIIQNFWILTQLWIQLSRRQSFLWNQELGDIFGHPWPSISVPASLITPKELPQVLGSSINRRDLSVVDICEAFGACQESSHFVLLDSASAPGQFSIVGVLSPASLQIQHRLEDHFVSITSNGKTWRQDISSIDIWTWLAQFIQSRKVSGGNPEIPFWGGFVGALSYELGVQTLKVPLNREGSHYWHPDVNLVFVERSIVLDINAGQIFVQSILPNDGDWVAHTISRLETLPPSSSVDTPPVHSVDTIISLPDKNRYISRINQAKEYLYSGDSYELCLTAQTRLSITNTSRPCTSTSWERYKRLRKSNPAPHSAYLRLHPTTLLSSSPERFLSVSRPPNPICQLRPIKGTVRKAPGLTRAMAEEALVGSAKEVAENLMIVDLIRHDIHGVVGDHVTVKQFCSVEEYETVWQLVSVIEGKLSPENLEEGAGDQLGWQVLKNSFPPGSMTGAPKKRSVEILQTLEDSERSVYSGVFGYWCVSGSSDWSVTIRSCFKFDDNIGMSNNGSMPLTEEWVIGAGGAITALSDADSEWDEMIVKLQSVLRSFGIDSL